MDHPSKIHQAITWSQDHKDYVAGIGLSLLALLILLFLLVASPKPVVEKKPTGMHGKELYEYLTPEH